MTAPMVQNGIIQQCQRSYPQGHKADQPLQTNANTKPNPKYNPTEPYY